MSSHEVSIPRTSGETEGEERFAGPGLAAQFPVAAPMANRQWAFAPLSELMSKFLAAGGKILACGPCLKKRGVSEDRLLDGIRPAGGAALVEWLSDGSPCVSY